MAALLWSAVWESLESGSRSPLARVLRPPVRLWALTAFLIVPLWLCAAPCRADLTIHGVLITRSGTIVDTLASTLQLKGSWLRRSLEGRGVLADFFGRRVELVNRASGERLVLDLDAETYVRSEGDRAACHPFLLIDLRWLGRTQGDVSGRLHLPDTSITLLGSAAFPVEFVFPARSAGGSTIRIWVLPELDSLFGQAGAQVLFCGTPDPRAEALVAERLAKQFGLSNEETMALRGVLDGFPARIENFIGEDGARTELSRFETLAVEHDTLPDSIFTIPKPFRPVSNQKP